MIENLNAEYEGSMTVRYICFRARESYEDFREKMLTNNTIGGYLSLNVENRDGEKIYKYDISGKKAVSEILSEKNVTEDFLIQFLKELERILLNGKGFMFDENDLILHPDAIYVSPEGHISVCCLPGYEKNLQEQLCSLLRYFMNCVDISDRRSVYAVYSSYVAAGDENCTFGSLIRFLESNKELPELYEPESGEQRNRKAELTEADGKQAEESFGTSGFYLSGKRKRQLSGLALAAAFLMIMLYFIFGG